MRRFAASWIPQYSGQLSPAVVTGRIGQSSGPSIGFTISLK
jgi:hypothetical protein